MIGFLILVLILIIFPIWQSFYNYNRYKKLKVEYANLVEESKTKHTDINTTELIKEKDSLIEELENKIIAIQTKYSAEVNDVTSTPNAINTELAELVDENKRLRNTIQFSQERYDGLNRMYNALKSDKVVSCNKQEVGTKVYYNARNESANRLSIEKIQENTDIFLHWDIVGELYNLKVKDTSFVNVLYSIKCNYVNKGWKFPELIKSNSQCCSIKIGDAYVTFDAPIKGVVTYNEKSTYEKGDTILSIEGNDTLIAEFERKQIKEKLLEKKRKQEFEKQALQELIDEGEIFPEANKRPPITKEVADTVWNRDCGKCVYCGSTENLHFDHIIPFSKGGDTSVENLQLLCSKCNLAKSNKIG